MSLYTPTDQLGQPLNTIYAEDVAQLVNVLTGQRDAGALSLLQALAAPAAPSVTLQSGAITGTGYQWGVYWITGLMDGTGTPHVTGRTPYGTLTTAQALTSQQATISISGLTPPTGAIGWGVARNKSGGSTWYTVPGSEQFMSVAGTIPSSFVDNVADASLVSAAPTVNTTGTHFAGADQVTPYSTKTSPVSNSAGSWALGTDVFATALTFEADGASTYVFEFSAPAVTHTQISSVIISLNLDGADGGYMMGGYVAAATQYSPVGTLRRILPGLAAGTHTVNARIFSGAGTTMTLEGGNGGASGWAPIVGRVLAVR